MEFKELESFIALANCKSFSKAASQNFVSQPTISNHIQLLEKELDTVLIDRSSKQIRLTPAGETFLVHAKRIINEKDLAFSAIDEYKGKIFGKLKIASSTIPSHYFLPEMLSKFYSSHPETSFDIVQSDTEGVHKMLKSMEIDFGITGAILDPKNYDYQKIISDELILIAPKTFNKNSLSLEALNTSPLIIRESGSGTRKVLSDFLLDKGRTLAQMNVIAEVSNNELVMDLVALGMGLSVISKRLVDKCSLEKVKVVTLEDFEITRSFYFTSRKSHTLLPLSIAFRNFVFKEIKSK